jgi:hypothetical protein
MGCLKMPIDKEKADVYKILSDQFAKLLIVFVALVIWITIVVAVIYNPNWPLGFVNILLPPSLMLIMFKHFFPPRGRR